MIDDLTETFETNSALTNVSIEESDANDDV
jgi:hypothetical protein